MLRKKFSPTYNGYVLGLKMDFFVSKHIALNYSLGFGYGQHKLFVQTTAGVIGAGSLLQNTFADSLTNGAYGVAAILIALLPEVVTYYHQLSPYITYGLFLNPLTYGTIGSKEGLMPGAGIKLLYNLSSKVLFTPSFSINYTQIPNFPYFFKFGIAVGYRF